MILKKIFLKLINNAAFGKTVRKTVENVRRRGHTKLVTTERTRNYKHNASYPN